VNLQRSEKAETHPTQGGEGV